MRLPNRTWVPFSTNDTKRICGYALLPRLAPGRPNASSLPFSSAISSVLPSILTRRHDPYHAPFVAATAIGCTISSCSCRSFQPSLVRACEMPELPATWMRAEGTLSHWIPSSRQRNTSRQDDCIYNARAMT